MDWKDIAKIIAPLAPVAGSIVGGLIPFPGGSIIGQKLGELIARQFGVAPTADAVNAAIAGNPNDVVLAKINSAMVLARAEIDGFVEIEKATNAAIVASIEQTGQTMRVEVLPENRHWYYTGWRPACGWLFFGLSALFGLQLSIAAAISAFGGNPAPLKALVDAWPAFLALFAPLGLMVGVYVYARSADKAKGVDTSAIVPAPAKPPVKK